MSAPSAIFDRKLYLERQGKASGEVLSLIWQHIADDLDERLGVINHQFDRVLLIAGHPNVPHGVLARSGKCHEIIVHPVSPHDDLNLGDTVYDAVFSLLDLQCADDVPGYLAQISRVLKADGLAMVAFFAGETLIELRKAWLAAETAHRGGVTPRVAPMIDLRETGGLLQRAGLALPVADLDRVTLRYDHPLTLMRDVKAAGYANPLIDRSRTLTHPSLLMQVAEAYCRDTRDADGKIRVTLEVAWATAWKPHPAQQQPLKPGSAKVSLVDALKVRSPSEG